MTPAQNILVLNHLADRHIEAIKQVVPDAQIIVGDMRNAKQYMPEADILVAWGWMNIEPIFQEALRLKWVHALSAGVEQLVFPSMQQSGITLTNSRGIHGIPVSEHVFSFMLAFTRGLNFFIRNQQAKKWERVPTDEIHDKTLGIVGLGSIGREIAKKAKGLGMHVVAVKREITTELFVDKLFQPDKLFEMLPLCDFVVSALPLTEETKGLFGKDQFAAMKRTAYFINIARGAVVNEAELVTALQQETIRGAGLDVFEHEPLTADSPLWDLPNAIITPHVAALSPVYLDRAIKLFTDNLVRYVEGREMLNVIDKQKGY